MLRNMSNDSFTESEKRAFLSEENGELNNKNLLGHDLKRDSSMGYSGKFGGNASP